MKKKIILKILKDPKHWLGWLITTGAVVGTFLLLKNVSFRPIGDVLIIFGIIILIDLIKHKIKLQ